MNNQFKEIIAKILLINEKQVTEDLNQEDLEDWDSMTHLVLISEIENEYDVQFTDDEVTEIHSIRDLIETLARYNRAV